MILLFQFGLLLVANLNTSTNNVCAAFSLLPTRGAVVVVTSTNQNKKRSNKSSLLFETSSPTTSSQPPKNEETTTVTPKSEYDSLIAGGGPAGLMTAIMLSRKFGPSHTIGVCERRSSSPPEPSDETVWNDVARFYLLGIGHRGQSCLQKFGVYDDFVKASVLVKGRRDWQPGQNRVEDSKITLAKKEVPSRVLARDKLVGVLHHHIVNEYADANIDLLYGYEVEPVDFGTTDNKEKVTVQISKCGEEETTTVDENDNEDNATKYYTASQDLGLDTCNVEGSSTTTTTTTTTRVLIGADGSARTIANFMEQQDTERISKINPFLRPFSERPFRVTRFEDDNPRLFKSIPIHLPKDWPGDLNYSARSSTRTLEALPSDENGTLCALLLLKPEDEFAQPNVDPQVVRDFFDSEFPQFSALIADDDLERMARKPASTLPAFRYVGPRLHDLTTARAFVLGDAAHTVKPYYGLGANSAFEDVELLSNAIDDIRKEEKEDDFGTMIPLAVRLFSRRRSGDASALVTMSRNMDRPGKLFYVNFLLPLILDGIFHKMAPRIFGPNMFGMFQKKGWGFQRIQRKKRFDRTLQFACLGTLLTATGYGTHYGIRTAVVPFLQWAVLRRSPTTQIVTATAAIVALARAGIMYDPKEKNNNNRTLQVSGIGALLIASVYGIRKAVVPFLRWAVRNQPIATATAAVVLLARAGIMHDPQK